MTFLRSQILDWDDLSLNMQMAAFVGEDFDWNKS